MNVIRNRTRRAFGAALLGVAALALGVSGPGFAAEPVKVKLAELYQIHGTHMFDPLFPERAKKYGVDVEVVPMRRYGDVQLALATGQVQFGSFGYFNIGTMADNNIHNVKIIAGNSTGGQGLILKKGLNAKIKTWKDLEGHKIGLAPNGAASILFLSLLKSHNVDVNKVTQVSFPGMGPEAVRALQTGDVDGLVTWEPTNARAVLEGIAEYSTLKLEESPTGNINGAFAVNTDFAAQHPEAVVAVLKALVDTTNELNKNHEAWIKLAAAKTGVEQPVVKTAIDHLSIYYEIPEAKIKTLLGILSEYGLTKKDYRDAVPQYVDFSYLEKATGKGKKALGGE
jgi:ABC-type nitrate/sulfonate/bicarbonate transport system substrate-binding protein